LIGIVFNYYIEYVDKNHKEWCKSIDSHHGLGHYVMYKLYHSENELIPISYTWMLFVYLCPQMFNVDDE
jgi:hypothetical protein